MVTGTLLRSVDVYKYMSSKHIDDKAKFEDDFTATTTVHFTLTPLIEEFVEQKTHYETADIDKIVWYEADNGGSGSTDMDYRGIDVQVIMSDGNKLNGGNRTRPVYNKFSDSNLSEFSIRAESWNDVDMDARYNWVETTSGKMNEFEKILTKETELDFYLFSLTSDDEWNGLDFTPIQSMVLDVSEISDIVVEDAEEIGNSLQSVPVDMGGYVRYTYAVYVPYKCLYSAVVSKTSYLYGFKNGWVDRYSTVDSLGVVDEYLNELAQDFQNDSRIVYEE